jgi:hypothetical protein
MDLGSDNNMLILISANHSWPVDTTEGARSMHSSSTNTRVGNWVLFFLPVSMRLAVLSKRKYRYLNFVYETLF